MKSLRNTIYLMENEKMLLMFMFAACFFFPMPILFWAVYHRNKVSFILPLAFITMIGGMVVHFHHVLNTFRETSLFPSLFAGNILGSIFFLSRYLILRKYNWLKVLSYSGYLLLLIVILLFFYVNFILKDEYLHHWAYILLYFILAIMILLIFVKQYPPQKRDNHGRNLL